MIGSALALSADVRRGVCYALLVRCRASPQHERHSEIVGTDGVMKARQRTWQQCAPTRSSKP